MTTEHTYKGRTFVLVPFAQLGMDPSRSGCRGCAFDKEGCYGAPTCTGAVDGQYREKPELLTEDPDHGDPAVSLAYKPSHGGYPEGPAMPLASDQALARTTDPETSHKAAASVGGGKLVDLMLIALQTYPDGLTGKEFSERLGKPLNSITPRLAPMRRRGLIHAAGARALQTVWKLGNGVAA